MRSRNRELPVAVEIRQVEEHLHVYDGLARAMSEPHAVLDIHGPAVPASNTA